MIYQLEEACSLLAMAGIVGRYCFLQRRLARMSPTVVLPPDPIQQLMAVEHEVYDWAFGQPYQHLHEERCETCIARDVAVELQKAQELQQALVAEMKAKADERRAKTIAEEWADAAWGGYQCGCHRHSKRTRWH